MSRNGRDVALLLEAVARDVEFPATPQLASSVRARIESGPIPVATISVPRTRPPLWRPVLAAASVVLLALAVTLALSVTARRAVADFLGVVGIRITFDGDAPDVPANRSSGLGLGESVSLAEASRRAGFDAMAPARREVGAVYFNADLGSTGMVSVVYPADAASMGDVELLVTQFVASVDETFFKKLAYDGADVTYVRIGSTDGYWVGGEHLFYYEDSEGRPREETVRLAGRVLLWEDGGITYRVEGARSLEAALRLARNLR